MADDHGHDDDVEDFDDDALFGGRADRSRAERSTRGDDADDLDDRGEGEVSDLSDIGWSTRPSDPTEAVRIIAASDDPPLRFGAGETGPMPHWTEPPTGEMPGLFGEGGAVSAVHSSGSWADELSADEPSWSRASSTDDPSWPGATTPDASSTGSTGEHGVVPSGLVFGESEPAEPRVTTIRTQQPSPRRRPQPADSPADHASGRGTSGRNLPVAVGVGLGIAAVYLGLAQLGPKFVLALVVVVLGLAAAELYEAQRKAGYQPATFIGLAATVAMPLVTYWRGHTGLPVVLVMSVVAVMLWLLLSGTLDSAPMPNASATILGIVYIGLFGSYAGLILRQQHGLGTMFTLIASTVAYDVIGLFAGSSVGRSPLIRWVSPNKTIEGLLAGSAAAIGVAWLCMLGHVQPWDDKFIHTIQLGIVIAIAAPIGDLVESMLKRSLGVKDMGDLLPGHGGVLDRFDAFLFVLPSVYYLGLVLNVPIGVR